MEQNTTPTPLPPPSQSPPAGWYPDPSGSGQSYWDGVQWTGQHSATPPSATSNNRGERTALVPLGYIFAIIMPFIGFVLGIIAATRPRGRARRNGPWIIVLSAVVFVVWVGIIVHSAERSNHEAAQRVTHEIQRGTEEIKKAGEELERTSGQEQSASNAKLKREEEKLTREQAELEHR